MPPRASGEDPPSSSSSEPFPPLRLSETTAPSYASVLRQNASSSSSSIDPPPPAASNQTDAEATGIDDVDRTEALDDLNSFLGIASSSRPNTITSVRRSPIPSSLRAEPARESLGGAHYTRDNRPFLLLDGLWGGDSLSSESSPTDQTHADPSSSSAPRIVFDYPSNTSSDITLRARALAQRLAERRRTAAAAEPPRAQPMERRPLEVDDGDEDDNDSIWEWTGGGLDGYRLHQVISDQPSVVGGSGATVSLRRGGNNRRRRSILERIQDSGDEEDIAVEVEGSSRSAGLPPTNVEESRAIAPLVVRSSTVPRTTMLHFRPPWSAKRARISKFEPVDTARLQTTTATPHPAYLSFTTIDPSVRLPTAFEPPSKKSRVHLSEHNSNGIIRPCITFSYFPLPTRDPEMYASALRTTVPIPVQCGIHYYEVEVLDSGENGYMSVGWMRQDVSLDRLVGWDKGSYGWHGDDGRSFEGQGIGEEFSDKWTKGDIVGCGIDFVKGRAFFTKNGKLVGYCFKKLGSGLYPAIGLRSPHESLVINFTGPFKYDIDGHVRDKRDCFWWTALNPSPPRPYTVPKIIPLGAEQDYVVTAVDSGAVPTARDVPMDGAEKSISDILPETSPLRNEQPKVHAAFVLNYLEQHGHSSALSSVISSMRSRKWLRPDPNPLTSNVGAKGYDHTSTLADFPNIRVCVAWLEKRLQHAGELEYAIPLDLLRELLPGSEGDSAGMSILHYLYLLRRAETEQAAETTSTSSDGHDLISGDLAALKYAQDLDQVKWSWSKEYRRAWKEALGLMSIPALSWPQSSVAGPVFRQKAIAQCISAIKARHRLPNSYLEQAFAQAQYVNNILATQDAEAAFVDVRRVLNEPGSVIPLPEPKRKKLKTA